MSVMFLQNSSTSQFRISDIIRYIRYYLIKFISRANRHGKASAQFGHRLGWPVQAAELHFLSKFASCVTTMSERYILNMNVTSKSFLFFDQSGWFYKYEFSYMSWWHPECLSMSGQSSWEELFEFSTPSDPSLPRTLPLYRRLASFALMKILPI